MATSNKQMIHKLQTAINNHGGCILLDKSQFFSEDQNRPITIYKVCTKSAGATKKQLLFKTSSQIQIVLYLRDYWFTMQGKELPKSNEMWNDIKEKQGIKFDNIGGMF